MTTKKNKTIGTNPLTEYLTNPPQINNPQKKKPQDVPTKTLKQRVTIHLSVDLIDKVKNAVFWEPGLTLTEFAQQALTKELKRWEKEWGEQYPQRKAQLKGGRPLK